MSKPDKHLSSLKGGSPARRKFLAGAAIAGGAAALVANKASIDVEQGIEESTKTASGKGYQETDHVRAYYKTASV